MHCTRRQLMQLGAIALASPAGIVQAQRAYPPGATVERHDPYGPDSGPEIWVQRAPPPPRRETAPGVRRGYAWAPGHWRWNGRAYRWVPGHYVRTRAHMRYVPPHWEQGPRGWRYYEGYWTR